MRAAYTSFLNGYPLVVPAVIFGAVCGALLPFTGPYSAIIGLVVAGKLTAYW